MLMLVQLRMHKKISKSFGNSWGGGCEEKL